MKCPRCGFDTEIVDSRSPGSGLGGAGARALATLLGDDNLRWRRHECLSCAHRYNTVELPVSLVRQLVETIEGRES